MNFEKFLSGKAVRNFIYYVIVFVAGIFASNGWLTDETWDLIIPAIVAVVFSLIGLSEDLTEDDDIEDEND